MSLNSSPMFSLIFNSSTILIAYGTLALINSSTDLVLCQLLREREIGRGGRGDGSGCRYYSPHVHYHIGYKAGACPFCGEVFSSFSKLYDHVSRRIEDQSEPTEKKVSLFLTKNKN